MKIHNLILGLLMLTTSCKKEEEVIVIKPKEFTHSTSHLGQVKLTDDALCADVIMTSLCNSGVCTQHVNLIESPCADFVEMMKQESENLQQKKVQ